MPNLWRACPISLGRGGRTVGSSTRGLNAGVSCGVHDELAVLLEWLPREYLGEQVSRVVLTWYVTNNDTACTAQLAHLEHLTIDVT